MTQPIPQYTVGVDVSKNTLDLYELATNRSSVIANATEPIEQWLDPWLGPIRLAIELTNSYHLAIAHAAHARGHQVYLVDPYRLTHYRAGIGQRVKTDDQDARLLARYLQHEASELRLWEPLPQGQQQFWHLLRRRATLVQTVTRMKQSLTDLGSLQADVDALLGGGRTGLAVLSAVLASLNGQAEASNDLSDLAI